MSQRIYINDGWGFTEEYSDGLNDAKCQIKLTKVRVPHTVKELPYNCFDAGLYQMVSGYRKVLKAPKDWEGKTVLLTFEAVGHEAVVYINGKEKTKHSCGYTAFTVDITEDIVIGKDNVIVVKCDSRESLNVPPFGFVIDYMTYGGIYRDVYIDVKEGYYISDVFARPVIPEDTELPGAQPGNMRNKLKDFTFEGSIDSSVEISSRFPESGTRLPENMKLVQELVCRKCGRTVAICGTDADSTDMEISIDYDKARLWDVTSPRLYTLVTKLLMDGEVIDERKDTVGFRQSEFRKEGYFLNGRKLKIRGLNRHQAYPYVGYAMPESMQRMDADVLKFELGLNAVRTSHYPDSQYFIERCNEVGLLVFTEIPGWQHIGDDEWKNQAVRNVREMVTQYRNHPSIILWGVRINESIDCDELYTRTNALSHELDPTRQTGGVRYLKKSSLLEDVYTFNDFSHTGKNAGCEKKRNVTPDINKPYLISEYNGHMFPTKAFDNEEHRLEHALRHANVLESVNENKEICGSFGWCMADYNTHKDFGSGDRICYHGVLDMFRNPKMAAYVYAVNQTLNPVLEVSSSMDIGEHPAGDRGNVYIFTNADSVRMYKNDHLLKEYTHKDTTYKNLRFPPILIDDYVGDMLETEEGFSKSKAKDVKNVINYIARYGMVHMTPDILLTMGKALTIHGLKYEDAVQLYGKYVGNWGGEGAVFKFEAIKDGEVVKTIVKTTFKTVSIDAKASSKTLVEKHSYDVAAVRIKIVEENQNVVPYFNGVLSVKAEGAIKLIGPTHINAAGGMSGVYVKSNGKAGTGKLTLKLPDEYAYLGEKATKEITFDVRIGE